MCCDPRPTDSSTGPCGQCDNVFVFCLRPINTTGFGCNGAAMITSDVNEDSEEIDFDSNVVLGFSNPFLLSGLGKTWRVSLLFLLVKTNAN